MYLVLQRKFYHYDIKEFKINEKNWYPLKETKTILLRLSITTDDGKQLCPVSVTSHILLWNNSRTLFGHRSPHFGTLLTKMATVDSRRATCTTSSMITMLTVRITLGVWAYCHSLLPVIAFICYSFAKKRMVLCPYVCQLKGLKEENYPKNNVLTENGAATGHNFWNLPI